MEVELALGALLYRDASVCVYSVPGIFEETPAQANKESNKKKEELEKLKKYIRDTLDGYARDLYLETPPYCAFSGKSSRSLVGITEAMQQARQTLRVPLHRSWDIAQDSKQEKKNTCPICQVRPSKGKRQSPCTVCNKRRSGRLAAWLEKPEEGSIWISDLADRNGRVALLTLSLELEPWLDGSRTASLRSQSIHQWRQNNGELGKTPNPVCLEAPYKSLVEEITKELKLDDKDKILIPIDENDLDNNGKKIVDKIVQNRAVGEAPDWEELTEDERARWFAHQLFCKHPSPGRVYRFVREGEEFFKYLQDTFTGIVTSENPEWKSRLRLTPKDLSAALKDNTVLNGHFKGAPLTLLYRSGTHSFLTLCGLDRFLERSRKRDDKIFTGKELSLYCEDMEETAQPVTFTVDKEEKEETRCPLIPLERSPLRFRVLIPLETANECVKEAIDHWKQGFGRVWDRLPLQIGIAAFPRMLPYQAVVEASRNLEHELSGGSQETWQVTACTTQDGVCALHLDPQDGGAAELHQVPLTLPGMDAPKNTDAESNIDVFTPYMKIQQGKARYPKDFEYPGDKALYRHVTDLRGGDAVQVSPSCIATLFLDSTGARFRDIRPRRLGEWRQMQDLWEQLKRSVPSFSALKETWALAAGVRERWEQTSGQEDSKGAWPDLVRTLFAGHLRIREKTTLDFIAQAAADGTLEWCLEWHLGILKQQTSEGTS